MCKFIGIEDLAANALIEIIEDGGLKKVSFEKLIKYGNVIIKIYGKENHEEAVLLISKDYTNEVVRNYSDFFAITEELGKEFFSLREGKSVDDLRAHFRAYLSIEMLTAFTREESLIELGISA